MLKKHDLGITPYIENISSRDQSLVRMGTSRVYMCSVNSNYLLSPVITNNDVPVPDWVITRSGAVTRVSGPS